MPNRFETCWTNASSFKIFRHPIPGTSGVRAMDSFATFAENAQPALDTAYLAFNQTYRMLIILHVRADGRRGLTKEYVLGKKHAFRVEEFLAGLRHRTKPLTVQEVERLLNDVLDTASADS
jgi:hypothetical protein